MKLLLFALAAPCLTFGQSATSVVTPRLTPATVNYYIATGGSNSNPCTSASKCLTLAHAVALVPRVLDANYIINVADGTYAEQIDTSGFIGGNFAGGNFSGSLKILGNTTTPANVVFSGQSTCDDQTGDSSFHSGACVAGTARVLLSGLTVTTAQRNGIACFHGNLDLNKVVVTMTGGSAAASVAFDSDGCYWNISGNFTATGFDTTTSPTGGLGIYNGIGSYGSWSGGTVTVTGPGTGSSMSADGTTCFVIERGAVFNVLQPSITANISGCQIGMLISGGGTVTNYFGATLALSNGITTPTTSTGISLSAGGIYDGIATSVVTIDHYTTGIKAAFGSGLAAPTATTTITNTSTPTSAIQGAQIVLF